MIIFLCFTWKIIHIWALCMILATRFTFIIKRSWKNMYFHPKLVWPPAIYDVISCNHSNWPSLNLSQNVCERWKNSYWKRQEQMFYPLGKNLEKPYGGWYPSPPPPPPNFVSPESRCPFNCGVPKERFHCISGSIDWSVLSTIFRG